MFDHDGWGSQVYLVHPDKVTIEDFVVYHGKDVSKDPIDVRNR